MLVVKTYRADVELVARLMGSIRRYNREDIPVYLIVPSDDVTLFTERFDGTSIIDEAVFALPALREPVEDLSTGYIDQQCVKLSLHQLGLAKNYFVVDSDCYFIRDFFYSDFVNEDGIGYSVLGEEKDRFLAPWYQSHAAYHLERTDKIADYFELPRYPRRSSHGNVVLLSSVLAAFEQWRKDQGVDLEDLMHIAPLEFSWYNFYLQRYHADQIIAVEPFIKAVHTSGQFRSMLRDGYTTRVLAKGYVGVSLNSSWAGGNPLRAVQKLERGSRVAKVMNLLARVWDYAAKRARLARQGRN